MLLSPKILRISFTLDNELVLCYLTIPSHVGLPPPLPMLMMRSPKGVMAAISSGVSPSGATMNTYYGSPGESSFTISIRLRCMLVYYLSPPLPIMLEGSMQDFIIAGTFSGVSPIRATMTTYAASLVVSPFENSNQQYEALRYYTPMMQQHSILGVPRMEHLQQRHCASPDAFVTSSTASTPLSGADGVYWCFSIPLLSG